VALYQSRSNVAICCILTSDRPEEVGILIIASNQNAAVGCDNLYLDEVIDRQAVLWGQPAEATAQSQTTNTYIH
jgi:hypothetical protein